MTQTVTTVNSDGTTTESTPNWRFGWAAGAGGEMRLWNTNWLARVEYLHYDFGNSGSTLGIISSGAISEVLVSTTSQHLTVDAVRAGVTYKFN